MASFFLSQAPHNLTLPFLSTLSSRYHIHYYLISSFNSCSFHNTCSQTPPLALLTTTLPFSTPALGCWALPEKTHTAIFIHSLSKYFFNMSYVHQHSAGYKSGARTNLWSLAPAGPSISDNSLSHSMSLVTSLSCSHLTNFPNLPHVHSDFPFCFSQTLNYEGWFPLPNPANKHWHLNQFS